MTQTVLEAGGPQVHPCGEAGIDRVLKIMNKQITRAHRAGFRICREEVDTWLFCRYDDATHDDVEEMINFASGLLRLGFFSGHSPSSHGPLPIAQERGYGR